MIWKFVRVQKPQSNNRRRHPRHAVSRMRAELGEFVATVADISEASLRLTGVPSWVIPGQGITVKLLFPTYKREVLVPIRGHVLRRESHGTVVVYNCPIDDWPASFRSLIQASDPLPV